MYGSATTSEIDDSDYTFNSSIVPWISDDAPLLKKVCTNCHDTLHIDAGQGYHPDLDTIEVNK